MRKMLLGLTFLLGACAGHAPPLAEAPLASLPPAAGLVTADGETIGTATALGGHLWLTSRHVIEGRVLPTRLQWGGREHPIALRAISARQDIALIEACGTDPQPAPRWAAATPPPGAPLFAAGIRGREVVAVRGHAAQSVQPLPAGPWHVARLPVRGGFSGGPVVDAEGGLLGLVTAAVGPDAAQLAFLRGGPAAPSTTALILVLPAMPAAAELLAQAAARPGRCS
jgi:hypothetical protein